MTLARDLWTGNADIAAAALEHPFVRGIGDGSLPPDRFAHYVAQDAFFLDAFARAYALGVAHSPDRRALETFADLLAGVRQELRLHTAYAARWDVDLPTVEPAPATLAYTDFVLATASLGRGVDVLCAALTPCLRLYAFLGRSLSARPAAAYAEWVETYADPQFESLAGTLEGLLDAYADDSPRIRATYRRGMELELAFLEAASRA